MVFAAALLLPLLPHLVTSWLATLQSGLLTDSFLTQGTKFLKIRMFRNVAIVLREDGCGFFSIESTGKLSAIGSNYICGRVTGRVLSDMEIYVSQSNLNVYLTDSNNARSYICQVNLSNNQLSTLPDIVYGSFGSAKAIGIDHKNGLLFFGHTGRVSMWSLDNPVTPTLIASAFLSNSEMAPWSPNCIAITGDRLMVASLLQRVDLLAYSKTTLSFTKLLLTSSTSNTGRAVFYFNDISIVYNAIFRSSDLSVQNSNGLNQLSEIRGALKLDTALILADKSNVYVYHNTALQQFQTSDNVQIADGMGIWIRNDLLYVPRYSKPFAVYRLSNTNFNIIAAYQRSDYPNYAEPDVSTTSTTPGSSGTLKSSSTTLTTISTKTDAETSNTETTLSSTLSSNLSVESVLPAPSNQPADIASSTTLTTLSSSSLFNQVPPTTVSNEPDKNATDSVTEPISNKKDDDPSSVIPIIAGAASAFLVCLLIAGSIYVRRRKRSKVKFDPYSSATALTVLQPSTAALTMTGENQGPVTIAVGSTTMFDHEMPLALPMYRVIQFDDIKLGSIIQEGGFGVVYRGTLTTTPFSMDQDEALEEVVVKVPKEEKMAQRHRIAFNQEISILSRFSRHQNFVKFIGFCQSPTALVLKYYPGRSLFELVHRQPPFSIPDSRWYPALWKRLFEDIVAAVAALHEVDIAHCDLKPGNVLIELNEMKQFRCLLTDFGIARVTSQKLLGVQAFQASEINGASINYSPPEILLRGGRKSHVVSLEEEINLKAADVYALGATLSEIMVRKIPWYGKPVSDIVEAVIHGERPYDDLKNLNLADPLTSQLLNVVRECYSHAYAHRPTAAEIRGKLKEMG